ncbi:MAG: LysM peptidoglycan-binding domain-containing protein [Bacteroidia bacterium]|nr:LysM peptidoglycan-binding domain-containing protein [Bacteroidia bacterium]
MKTIYTALQIVIFIMLCTAQYSCVAQTKTTTTQTVDGKKYYMHTVEKGQTLYGISKLYEVDKNDIVLENPKLIDGLKLGVVLKIPYTKITTTTKPESTSNNYKPILYSSPIATTNGTIHTVEKSQTLYSISKLYNTTVDDILKLNATLKDNSIKEGDQVIVSAKSVTANKTTTEITPAKVATTETISTNEPTVTFDPIPTKTAPKYDEGITNDNQINIALLLPLFSNSFNDSVSLKSKIFSGKAMVALEFYNGFMMSVDTLKSKCVTVNLNVYDVENDSLKTLDVLSKKELKNANVVIGPFYTSTALITSEYCAEKNKLYISPVSPNNKVLVGNAKAYKTMASTQTQFEYLANYITNNAPTQRIISVYFDGAKQKTAINYFNKNVQLQGDSVRTVNYKKQGLKYLQSQLSSTKPNKIILAITEQSVANEVVNKLKTLAKIYDIQLLCGDTYLGFENIDYETLQQLKFRAVSNTYTDYTLPKTQNFVTEYKNKYKSEPSKYSMNGYDLGCWLARNYSTYQNINNLFDTQYEGVGNKYIMRSVGANNGYENFGLYLVGYNELKLIVEP